MEGRTHVPLVNEALCGVCGICRGACPALASPDLAEGETGTMRAALAPQATQGNEDLAPCQDACPLGQDINGYLACLAKGDQQGALEVILRDNPLPSVLGQVCHHPCQQACFSATVQAPPSIRDLKRFAAQAPRPEPAAPQGTAKAKVAVVGAGPAGLAAAWELARNGAQAVVYDAQPMAGGMLAWAIPDFRLPRIDLQRDLDYILAHGVEFKLGQALTPEDVAGLRDDYDAVILACGAPQAKRSGLPGEDLKGVWQGLDFLREAALDCPPQLTAPVVVVGGGNVALDAARVALRQGVAVTLAYRRDREQMPAYAEELEAAEAEGLKLVYRVQPVALEAGEGGAVAALKVLGTTPGQPAADGRVAFAPDPGDERRMEAGSVILALGQQSEADAWASGLGLDNLQGDAQGRLAPGLYLAGDLQTGPATVVEAMAGGIKAARAIMEEVRS
ncbi:MAG: FAD-dependent oxidoreductase [Desulfarculaceae bacterium]|nr:FAD-dependent oxidoreductase [Desulfarculaceae bacterium]MCF8046178.1 FAD-dependent oxidoreductase [Desulfarculaceae bacterium]MCF8096336.1 FAD-dependent oxidoreductase [Desulfarculaceae bacterium]MCF8121474.1 FAD-dependent oxidoreductase [Desulfarculaceae bacterium]